MIDLSSIINLARDLNLIEQVRWKLVRQNEPAAAKLAEVLDELAKMVGALDAEIVRYLSLSFNPETVVAGRAVLLGLEAGQSMVRMGEARGHCHKIANIYEKYLKRWFHDVLDPGEAQQIDWLFGNLSTADSMMLGAMDGVTRWLRDEAQQTLDMVDLDNFSGANQRIRDARMLVRDARVQLTEAMGSLRAMQAEFIAVARAV
ncbi:MAG TPA: hypothetical protein PKD53_27350 [Chloroflexaceae bacterium]|nr:hypothetical protein [Chloroflexaceae bacterium]